MILDLRPRTESRLFRRVSMIFRAHHTFELLESTIICIIMSSIPRVISNKTVLTGCVLSCYAIWRRSARGYHHDRLLPSRSLFSPPPSDRRIPFCFIRQRPFSLLFLIPRLSSLTVLALLCFCRLALSPLKGSSIFKPAANAVDKIIKPTASAPVKLGKMGKFAADSSAHVAYGPADLSKPFFVAKQMICFR